ncbi:MAG: hypothetical protein CMG58_00460 [Candidatus Marinimicrobia bacterium]|nr:hypothetical protein [Candidatus Neomarinimicrobiota bacterium]|tara:strand:- start:217 stop:1008 length:792 start_codon:yes stop_codon:yes gene_type:complete
MLKLFISLFIGFIFNQNYKQPPAQIPPAQNFQLPQMANQPNPIDPKLQKAIDEYEKLVKKHPEKSGLHYNLGNLKYLAGDYEGAINAFRHDISAEDNKLKADAMYNMGNTMYNQGKYQESMDFYKQALELNRNDDDAKINYEISKQMLQQQQQKQQNSENNEEGQEEKEKQQQDETQNQEAGEKKDSGEEQDSKKKQNEQQEKQQSSENEEDKQKEKQPQQSEEEKLAKEEAESILNALQANQKNLMKKKYKAKNRIKLEKDW